MALKCLIKPHLAIIAFQFAFLNIMKQYFRDNKITGELVFSPMVMEKLSIQIEHSQRCEIQRDADLQSSEVACVWTADTHIKLILQPGMCPESLKLQIEQMVFFFPFPSVDSLKYLLWSWG